MSALAYARANLRRRRFAPGGFPRAARLYLVELGLVATAVAVAAAIAVSSEPRWTYVGAVLAGAAVAQTLAFHTRGNQLFHTGLAFTVAAALILPPAAVVGICLAQHLPDWLRQRYPWYIQTFNIANYTSSALAAWATNHFLAHGHAGWSNRGLAAAAAAGLVFVLTNHVLLARMLRLARGHAWRATGLFSFDGLVTDLGLGSIGIGLAVAIATKPAAALLAIFPLVLIHRTFSIPELRSQAFTDDKTGLLNGRGLTSAAASEFARASRFGRPLSLIVADVDNLREINNRHGHLAGDDALRAVADAIRAETRDYDICARFGGDEFVVVLPETGHAEAEEVKARVASCVTGTLTSGSGKAVRVSASVGLATETGGDASLARLLELADADMYSAKRASPRPARFS